jgi:hypothetical protein
MALEALVPFARPGRELGLALSGSRQAITLDPGTKESPAEFTVWFATQLPERTLPVHLIENGSMRSIRLNVDTTQGDVGEWLDQAGQLPRTGRPPTSLV